MDVRYFELLFKTRLYVDQFIVFSKGIGSGFNRLYTPDFGAIAIAVPPEEEQARLLVKIDDDCAELNALIARTEREIDLIREYRTRLIADVVTGKVDVRGLAPAGAPVDDEQIDEGIDDEEMLGDDEPELVEEAADADD
jgi:type I restriction enzyme S subunit